MLRATLVQSNVQTNVLPATFVQTKLLPAIFVWTNVLPSNLVKPQTDVTCSRGPGLYGETVQSTPVHLARAGARASPARPCSRPRCRRSSCSRGVGLSDRTVQSTPVRFA